MTDVYITVTMSTVSIKTLRNGKPKPKSNARTAMYAQITKGLKHEIHSDIENDELIRL